ncbi:hypothetical protein AAC387_Pa06g0643 [Persea americana]
MFSSGFGIANSASSSMNPSPTANNSVAVLRPYNLIFSCPFREPRRGGRNRIGVYGTRKIEDGIFALEYKRRHVVGCGRHLGCREGAEPYSRGLARLPDLRHPFAVRGRIPR